MPAAPTGLREAIDRARPGVAFVPEGHADIAELCGCDLPACWRCHHDVRPLQAAQPAAFCQG